MKEVGSVYDNVQRTSYDYMKLLDKTYKDGYKVLIVDDKDGLNSIPFAKREKDYSNFSKNRYLRLGEIRTSFDSRLWNIKSLIEFTNDSFHKGHPNHKNDHYHRIGHIFAQKKILD